MSEIDTAQVSVAPSAHGRIPAVSIGMPVYNGAKYVSEAIDSLLAQTFTDYEIIISDNASSDATSSICREYARKDDRIRYIRQQENIGAIANFQFVLSEARAKYFMWAACDDRWAPTFIARAVAVANSDTGCSLVFSNYIEKNLETGQIRHHRVLPSNRQSAFYNYLTRTLNMCPSLIYGLYRSQMIKEAQFSLSFDFSDVHFINELALRSRIHVIDDYLYIAGTKGVRQPYSMTDKRINRMIFLRKQYALLKKHFYFPITQCLFSIVCLVMIYNKARLWRY